MSLRLFGDVGTVDNMHVILNTVDHYYAVMLV